jgi:hypothetical protein
MLPLNRSEIEALAAYLNGILLTVVGVILHVSKAKNPAARLQQMCK